MDINLLREAVTVLSFAGFLGIVAFAVNPRNRERFDEAARLPFADEPTPTPALPQGGGSESASPSRTSPKGEGANVGRGFAKLER